MNNEQFNEILEDRITKTRDVLSGKAKEYASNTCRLHNFKVAARMSSSPETPEQALWGMMRKHLVSVMDIIDKTGRGEFPGTALRDEKIGDTINYAILLEALLIERSQDQPEDVPITE